MTNGSYKAGGFAARFSFQLTLFTSLAPQLRQVLLNLLPHGQRRPLLVFAQIFKSTINPHHSAITIGITIGITLAITLGIQSLRHWHGDI